MKQCFNYLTLILFLFPFLAFSQGITTSSIVGTVKDVDGKPLAGATVKAIHLPSGTITGTVVNPRGNFSIPGLRPGGPYKVEITMVGFRPESKEDIFLTVGQEFTVRFILQPRDIQTREIQVVSDRNDIISSNRTGASQTVTEVEISTLPTIARSIHDYSRLSPLVISSTSEGSNVASRNSKYNNIQVDGAALGDAFGLPTSGTPGGQAGTEPISLDAIEEFQVSIAPFDVRQGMFTGGLINAITRSGTNNLRGSIYFYGRNQELVGKSPTPDANNVRQPYPDFSDYFIGGRIGGPIIENKLFYFVNVETKNRKDPQRVGLAGDQGYTFNFNISRDTLEKIRQIAINKYGYDPGSYDLYTRKTNDIKLFLRADFNIDQNNRLTLRHNFVKADQGNAVTRSQFAFSFSGQEYIFNSMQNQTVLQLNSIIGTNMANELRLVYTAIRDKRDPVSKPFPAINLYDIGPKGEDVFFGVERFSQANALDQDIFELTDNFTYFLGDHTITIGTSNQLVGFNNLFLQDYYGTYSFTSIADFEAGKPSQYQLSYSLLPNEPKPRAKWNYLQLGFYVQDEWKVLPNLKLSLGLRADMFAFPEKPPQNDSLTKVFPDLRTDQMPSPIGFSPRLGFNFDVFNDKTFQIRGGIGVFSGKTPGVWISNQFSNTGTDIGRIDVRNPKITFEPDPFKQYTKIDSLTPVRTTEINITDKNLKMPQVLRFNLALDKELPYGFIGTIEFVYGKTLYDMVYKNLNRQILKASNGKDSTLPDGRPLYSRFDVSPLFTNVLLMTNTSQGYQTSITFQIQKPFGKGFLPEVNLNLAYTWSRAKDVNSLTSSRAISNWQYNRAIDPNNPELGTSLFEIPHRILANFSYRISYGKGFATSFGIFYEGRSGAPFSLAYSNDANGDRTPDRRATNDLVYIPLASNDKVMVLKGGNWNELNQFISWFPELDKQRGKIVERNSLRQPWFNQLDLRITQEFPTFRGQSLQLYVDVLNLLNLINSDWGHLKFVSNAVYDRAFTYNGIVTQDLINDPKNGFTQADLGKMIVTFSIPKDTKTNQPSKDAIFSTADLTSRWQIQIGIRYSF
ncbi:MAG: carboxypeptidase regulatory-like domain-containing protein [Ignavibacteria bacterium]|nr:carboxypeptidase regulatory-like domain-containing protein [Ignavibacteria bacterium]